MRKLLLLVCTIVILSLAVNASAQIPFVQVFFDTGSSLAQKDCPGVMTDNLYVFAMNYNMYIAAIQYWIDLSDALTYLGMTLPTGALSIGSVVDPANGISISYPVPGDGFVPYVTMTISVLWNCSECTDWEITPITVHGFGPGGLVETVSWPDLTMKMGIGMISLICAYPPIPAEQTTWGSVKSLYQ